MKTIHTVEYKKLLDWIRCTRKEKGLTMRMVAQLMKVPHSWVGKVEIGERRLDIAEYVRFCRALGADPHTGLTLMESQMKARRTTPTRGKTVAERADGASQPLNMKRLRIA